MAFLQVNHKRVFVSLSVMIIPARGKTNIIGRGEELNVMMSKNGRGDDWIVRRKALRVFGMNATAWNQGMVTRIRLHCVSKIQEEKFFVNHNPIMPTSYVLYRRRKLVRIAKTIYGSRSTTTRSIPLSCYALLNVKMAHKEHPRTRSPGEFDSLRMVKQVFSIIIVTRTNESKNTGHFLCGCPKNSKLATPCLARIHEMGPILIGLIRCTNTWERLEDGELGVQNTRLEIQLKWNMAIRPTWRVRPALAPLVTSTDKANKGHEWRLGGQKAKWKGNHWNHAPSHQPNGPRRGRTEAGKFSIGVTFRYLNQGKWTEAKEIWKASSWRSRCGRRAFFAT